MELRDHGELAVLLARTSPPAPGQASATDHSFLWNQALYLPQLWHRELRHRSAPDANSGITAEILACRLLLQITAARLDQRLTPDSSRSDVFLLRYEREAAPLLATCLEPMCLSAQLATHRLARRVQRTADLLLQLATTSAAPLYGVKTRSTAEPFPLRAWSTLAQLSVGRLFPSHRVEDPLRSAVHRALQQHVAELCLPPPVRSGRAHAGVNSSPAGE